MNYEIVVFVRGLDRLLNINKDFKLIYSSYVEPKIGDILCLTETEGAVVESRMLSVKENNKIIVYCRPYVF